MNFVKNLSIFAVRMMLILFVITVLLEILDHMFSLSHSTKNGVTMLILFFSFFRLLTMFGDSFDFRDPINLGPIKNKITGNTHEHIKQKTEEEMLRAKKLLDAGVLTEDEYQQVIKPLKEKFLS